MKTEKTEVLLPIRRVCYITGKGKSSIWDGAKNGKFPKPIKVGGSARWLSSELDAFLKQLAAQRSATK